MPDSGAGIYEVVLKQTYLGVAVLNVFHYLDTALADDKQGSCGIAFNTDILTTISSLQSDQVTYDEILVRNLTGNLADVVTVPGVSNGARVGDEGTTFLAIPFRYNRTTKETRNGGKRFAGALEEFMTTTGFVAAFFTDMQTASLTLDNQIVNGGNTFSPIILKKPDLGLGIYTYNLVSNVTALNRTTSQNSRKAF